MAETAPVKQGMNTLPRAKVRRSGWASSLVPARRANDDQLQTFKDSWARKAGIRFGQDKPRVG